MARTSDKAYTWLTARQVAGLPRGTAVLLEDRGGYRRGRIVRHDPDGTVVLRAAGSERSVAMSAIVRARVIASTLEDGDPVLKVGVPASEWRGGVVRTSGRRVYVETLTGFLWMDEDELETPDARRLPSAQRLGPVPQRTVPQPIEELA